MQWKQNSQAISLCKTNQQDKHQYQQNMQQNPENPAKSQTKTPAKISAKSRKVYTTSINTVQQKENFQQNSEQFLNNSLTN